MLNSSDFSEKVAIVTGAGQGMGRAVAEKLAYSGARVIVNDLVSHAAADTAKDIVNKGGNAYPVKGDVTSKEDVSNLVQSTLDKYGSLNILVNNAGVLRPTPVIDIEEDEWDFVIGVNLKGTYMCSRAVLPTMRETGWGRIINFSSTAGKNISTVGGAHYTAAKAGILGFTRHLAKEEACHGITVNALCPGLIDTEMVRSTITEERVRAYAKTFPISRLGQPHEIAELVTFIASDKAAYITGASFDINGGDLMI